MKKTLDELESLYQGKFNRGGVLIDVFTLEYVNSNCHLLFLFRRFEKHDFITFFLLRSSRKRTNQLSGCQI